MKKLAYRIKEVKREEGAGITKMQAQFRLRDGTWTAWEALATSRATKAGVQACLEQVCARREAEANPEPVVFDELADVENKIVEFLTPAELAAKKAAEQELPS